MKLTFHNRANHLHVIGSTGSGKSKFLEHLIRQDIEGGQGCCLIDPHGTLYSSLTAFCAGRLGGAEVVLFDPAHEEYVPGFNPLATSEAEIDVQTEMMVSLFLSAWGEQGSDEKPLLERILRVLFRTISENNATLADVGCLAYPHTLAAEEMIERVADMRTQAEWEEFKQRWSKRDFAQNFSSTHNRLSRFLSSEAVRNVVGQTERVLDTAKVMDEGKILLVNLAPSVRMHPGQASVLGKMLLNDFLLKGLMRGEKGQKFYLYVDECSRFVTPDVSGMLDECRKFGLFLTLAHQYLSQLEEAGVRESVMADARNKVVFGGLDAPDAEALARNIHIGGLAQDVINHELDKPVPVDHERVWLQQSGESQSKTEGTSEGSGKTVSTSESELTSGGREYVTQGQTLGESSSFGFSESHGENSHYGWSQTYKPILETLPSQAYSTEEKLMKFMANMMTQPRGRFVFKDANRVEPLSATMPFVRSPLARYERVLRYEYERHERGGIATQRQWIAKEVNERQWQIENRRDTEGESDEDFHGV